MKKLNHFSNRFLGAVAVLLFRAGKYVANVSPLGAFGFFGGSPWIFLGSILAFDLFVGGLYRGFGWTYLGFAVYPLIGWLVRKQAAEKAVLFLPLASLGFFLLSNFGVWLYWYPATWEGLLTCYTLALPFFSRTLLSDLVFGGAYVLSTKLHWRRRLQSAVRFAV